jgi:hypothetical protein
MPNFSPSSGINTAVGAVMGSPFGRGESREVRVIGALEPSGRNSKKK